MRITASTFETSRSTRATSESAGGEQNLQQRHERKGSGIYIDGETNDTVIVGNEIGNQSEVGDSTQRFGVVIGAKASG